MIHSKTKCYIRYFKGRRIKVDDLCSTLSNITALSDVQWTSGTGMISIYQEIGKRVTELYIMFRAPFGYHFNYIQNTNAKSPTPMLSSVGSKEYTAKSKRISLFVGGDFWSFPPQAFVPWELARLVISDFLLDAKNSEKVTWLTPEETRFRTEANLYGKPY